MDENIHPDAAGRGNTKMCSVLFVDIVGYSKKTNAEQIVMKQQFVALWAQAIKDVPPDDIMVVDTGDGAALTALVEPEDTIRVAMAMRDATAENNKHNPPIYIRMGINFGPVQLSKDVHGKACIVGDAINIAQRIMSFADPGQVTISRSYYDVIKPLAHKYEEMFYYLGERSDKHVRHHHIYGLGQRGQAAPLGNAVSVGIGPIKDEEHIEEIKPYVPPKPIAAKMPVAQANPSNQAMQPKTVPVKGPGFFVSAIKSIWNFLVSILLSVLNSIRKFFRWGRFVALFLLIAYELIVLMPLMGSPENLKKEISRQAAAVTQFAKSGMSALGIRRFDTEAAQAQPVDKKSDKAATKRRSSEHHSKETAESGVPRSD